MLTTKVMMLYINFSSLHVSARIINESLTVSNRLTLLFATAEKSHFFRGQQEDSLDLITMVGHRKHAKLKETLKSIPVQHSRIFILTLTKG